MTIQSKLLPGPAAYGNTARISYTGSETAPALADVVDQNGDNPTSISFDRIEKVQNFSGGNVTGPGGYTFGPGTWDFDEAGGLEITTPVTAGQPLAGADNCIIVLRGKIGWTSVTDHAKAP